MTLVEQIEEIHTKYLGEALTKYRNGAIPRMLDDLKIKLFDQLSFSYHYQEWYLSLVDNVDILAIRKASLLVNNCSLTEDTPAVT